MVLIELYKNTSVFFAKETIKVTWTYGLQCGKDWSRLFNIGSTRFYKVKLWLSAKITYLKNNGFEVTDIKLLNKDTSQQSPRTK